ncbi:MAG: SRPBCC family protein [Pararhizobium sp.]
MMTVQDTHTLVVERRIAQPREKVWRALTESALIEDWLMKNDFAPVVGRRFQFRAEPVAHWNGVTDSEVLVVEPPARLSYRWDASGAEAANGLKTIVTWTLEETNGGTRLRMEQSGFRAEDTRNREGARYGWQRFLDGLDRVVSNLD